MCYMWERIRAGVSFRGRHLKAMALRGTNLKNVNDITISFDPWLRSSASLRDFWFGLTSKRIKTTNPRCVVRHEIRNDRQPPYFVANLNDGSRLMFKTEGMADFDIAMRFNRLTGQPEFGEPKKSPQEKMAEALAAAAAKPGKALK